jgi:hypothetical protein
VSAARHPARGPREPRERGVPRGWRPPLGEDPAHPANPARPFRGAGSRAGSGGLAAAAAAGPGGGRPALAGFWGREWPAAGPIAPLSPEASGGRVVRQRRVGSAPEDDTALTCRSVTLSDENALSRSQVHRPVPRRLRRRERRWRPLGGRFHTSPHARS